MTILHDTVFLIDVDNTLLNNDQIEIDIKDYLELEFGPQTRDRYWSIFEALRAELSYADYLGALQRLRVEFQTDPRLPLISSFLIDYPFADRLYPGVFDVLGYLRSRGPTVILSDGDAVFQPRKIKCSGLWEAVEGRVLIYIHKEQMLDAVMNRYPAPRYVMVDDKLRILAAMKATLADRLVSVFVRQGHYAFDPKTLTDYPPADITFAGIGDLIHLDLPIARGRLAG